MGNKFVASLFLVLTLMSGQAFADAGACLQAVAKSEVTVPFGLLRPDFVHNDHYDVELKSDLPVKNQCSLGVCHLYAWSANLENPHNIETSSEYLSAAYLMDVVHQALLDGNPKFEAEIGANAWDSINALRKVGLVPKGAWKGEENWNKMPMVNRLTQALRNIIAHTVVLRQMENDPIKQIQINQMAFEQIQQTFSSFIGELPKSFEYNGAFETPLSFAERYFPEMSHPLVSIFATDKKGPAIGEMDSEHGLLIISQVSDLERTARAVLDQGRPVWLGYSHQEQYVDRATGVMSIEAFNYPFLAQPPPRILRQKMKIVDGMHAVLIVGYELDPATGKVRKWKIRNSWGTKMGDEGEFHMYADYFNAFASNISYLNDGTLPIPGFVQQIGDQNFPLDLN